MAESDPVLKYAATEHTPILVLISTVVVAAAVIPKEAQGLLPLILFVSSHQTSPLRWLSSYRRLEAWMCMNPAPYSHCYMVVGTLLLTQQYCNLIIAEPEPFCIMKQYVRRRGSMQLAWNHV